MKTLRVHGYMPGLDVLRGLAILGVIGYHGICGRAPWSGFHGLARWFVYASGWGSSGVQLFFILSGFLITGILLDNVTHKDYYSRFYFNRVCRILPAFVLILMVLKGLHVISWAYLLACLLYIANMAKLVGGANSEYGAFWSLAVEEQFYLLWPMVVRRFSLKTLTRLISLYLVLDLVLRAALSLRWPSVDIQYKLWGNADWLLLGALVAIELRSGRLNGANIRRWKYGTLLGGLLTVPVIVWFEVGHPSPHVATGIFLFYRWPIVLVYLSMLLAVVERNRGKIERQSYANRGLSFFGYISYGLYLVHPLVYLKLDRWWGSSFKSSLWALLSSAAIGAVLSIAIAYVSRRYFEEFFLRLKQFRRSPRLASPPLAAAEVPLD